MYINKYSYLIKLKEHNVAFKQLPNKKITILQYFFDIFVNVTNIFFFFARNKILDKLEHMHGFSKCLNIS